MTTDISINRVVSSSAKRQVGNWIKWVSRNRIFVAEVFILILFLGVAILGPVLVVTDPAEQDLSRLRETPNPNAILGRDELGRDIFARLIHGARFTIGISIATVMIGLLIGGVLGLISGYYSNRTDLVIMRAMDMLLAFPNILLAPGSNCNPRYRFAQRDSSGWYLHDPCICPPGAGPHP